MHGVDVGCGRRQSEGVERGVCSSEVTDARAWILRWPGAFAHTDWTLDVFTSSLLVSTGYVERLLRKQHEQDLCKEKQCLGE
jgi:hypothetical protein